MRLNPYTCSSYKICISNNNVSVLSGANEPPKEHETYATCRVPSQSKLFEAVYGISRNKIAAHGDSEAYSSPKLVRHSLTF